MRALLVAVGIAFAGHAAGATYLVDTTADDGTLDACTTEAPGDCSLRGAITMANANTGPDTLAFDIPEADAGYQVETGHWRIAPAANLPIVSDDLVIDGYTQPGALENTLAPDEGGSDALLKIELHGNGGPGSEGLTAVNGNPRLVLRGLAINSFHINLALYSPGPHEVAGCYLGTDVTGMLAIAADPNSFGIRLRGQANVGGTAPAARNVISGNGYIGIWDESATTATTPSTFQGNLIGLAADGATVLPGQDYGLYASHPVQGSLIGGDTVDARNLFGGNELGAIHLTGNSVSAGAPPIRIQGNLFGTDWSGMQARPNGAHPASPSQPQPTILVFRSGPCGVLLGGDAGGEGNLVANGAAAGVQVASCTGAAILGNAFRGNRIGIDLSAGSIADGASPNDANDADEGGNRLQNAPVIEHAAYVDGGATLELGYRIDSAPGHAAYPLRVDVGWGSGTQAMGVAVIDEYTAADAQTVKIVQLPIASLEGRAPVLSATDAEGNTSEFASDALFGDTFEP